RRDLYRSADVRDAISPDEDDLVVQYRSRLRIEEPARANRDDLCRRCQKLPLLCPDRKPSHRQDENHHGLHSPTHGNLQLKWIGTVLSKYARPVCFYWPGRRLDNIPYMALKGDYTAPSAPCQTTADAIKARRAAAFGMAR